ncbi:MAG: HaeIII family restriction endonuclease [Endomicrobiaceae bacterium]|nr:HaeIII family restriction endonuclease [Endomicrobiaceae bacterium]
MLTTEQSTIKGKAYEYACVLALKEIVSKIRSVKIIENSSLEIAKARYLNDIDISEQKEMISSAKSGIRTIISMEPRITEDGIDELTVSLQPDNIARSGDVRDILVIRRSIKWEIGISVKHNHSALKHSRLSKILDFGKKWFGFSCSQKYFCEIKPIFESLEQLRKKGCLWKDLSNKENLIYMPLLNAFICEFKSLYSNNGINVVEGLIKYLIGSNGNDYYKLIHCDNHITKVLPFNLHGQLNQPTKYKKPDIAIPKIKLPMRIIELIFKNNSKTTVILTMDNGWAISFRIHNASSKVETSLKFDIQLVGQPADLFYLDVKW